MRIQALMDRVKRRREPGPLTTGSGRRRRLAAPLATAPVRLFRAAVPGGQRRVVRQSFALGAEGCRWSGAWALRRALRVAARLRRISAASYT